MVGENIRSADISKPFNEARKLDEEKACPVYSICIPKTCGSCDKGSNLEIYNSGDKQ
jgi:hypothetical protein